MQFKLKKIRNAASFREFFRLYKGKKTTIIVIAKKERFRNLVIYSAINKFLRNKGIYTPKLISKNFNENFIEIEDFGNKTLFDYLKQSKNKLKIYKKCVDVILKIQKISLNNLKTNNEKIKYNQNKYFILKHYNINELHKESDLFFDWYLLKILGKKKSLKYKKVIKKELENVYKKIIFKNIVLVQRDFHVSNIMLNNKKLGIIDTQDTIIGNPFYDLVSLIDDVRVKLPKNYKNTLYHYFLKRSYMLKKNYTFYTRQKRESSRFNFDCLSDCHILSIQRLLKILGIFARLHVRDGKSNYLKYLPNTWRLLESNLWHPYFYNLRKLLNKAVSKKKRKEILFK